MNNTNTTAQEAAKEYDLSYEGQRDILAHLKINQIVENLVEGKTHPYTAKIELFNYFKLQATQYPPTERGGLQWVRASEELPQVPEILPADTPDEKGILFINITHSCANFWYASSGCSPKSILNLDFEGWSLDQWQWLRDTPAEVSAPEVNLLKREETEIRDDAHLMHAEGTSDCPVTESAVISHLKNEGWEAYDIYTWYDNMQSIYRWVCSIRKPTVSAPEVEGKGSTDFAQSLRDSFFNEMKGDPTDSLASARMYFVWLEKYIIERLRPSPSPIKGQGEEEWQQVIQYCLAAEVSEFDKQIPVMVDFLESKFSISKKLR